MHIMNQYIYWTCFRSRLTPRCLQFSYFIRELLFQNGAGGKVLYWMLSKGFPDDITWAILGDKKLKTDVPIAMI